MSGGDRVIRAGLVVSLTVVTGIAVGVSYGHLYDLARANGETGVPAAVLPVTVDGLILACSLVIVNAARNRSRPPVLAWLLLFAGIGATLAGNVAHGLTHGWPGALVAGWPAVVAAGCFDLVIGEIRRGRGEVPDVEAPAAGDVDQLDDGGPVGMEWWGEMPTVTAETGDPAPVPKIETGPALDAPAEQDGTESGTETATGDPDLAPVIATARDHFAETIAAGRVPSVRAIRKEIRVGYPRAVQVREALADQ